jgi:hypothetical protein
MRSYFPAFHQSRHSKALKLNKRNTMFSKHAPVVHQNGIIAWIRGVDPAEPVEENDGGGPDGLG